MHIFHIMEYLGILMQCILPPPKEALLNDVVATSASLGPNRSTGPKQVGSVAGGREAIGELLENGQVRIGTEF